MRKNTHSPFYERGRPPNQRTGIYYRLAYALRRASRQPTAVSLRHLATATEKLGIVDLLKTGNVEAHKAIRLMFAPRTSPTAKTTANWFT